MSEELKGKVFEIIARVFNTDTSKLNVNLVKDDFESWDSIGHLQLVMNLESDFGIKFRIEEINKINSIQDCIDLVASYTK